MGSITSGFPGFFSSSWLTNVDEMKDLWCSSTAHAAINRYMYMNELMWRPPVISDLSCISALLMIFHLESLSICTERVVYICNLRVTKIAFSPFFPQHYNSIPHQHLEVLLVVSEAVVQKPSSFHPLSSVFKCSNYYMYIYMYRVKHQCSDTQ